MLFSGLELMALGMGMVFLFLVLLIVVMQGMSALAARLTPPAAAETAPVPRAVRGGTDQQVIAAISVAVRSYRASRGI